MDNKAYLDSIAVKGKDTGKASIPILSPMLIKIIAVGVVLAIAMMFVGSLLSAAWQNVIDFFPAFIEAIVAKDWSEACIRLLIIASAVLMIYRLVRKMPFVALRSVWAD